MPCEGSKTENENEILAIITGRGHLEPLINLMNPSEIPIFMDSTNDVVGGGQAGDGQVLTNYASFTQWPEAGEYSSQPTITIASAVEKVTITVTMAPSTLATSASVELPTQTVTRTVTVLPPGKICTTPDIAVIVPIACIFGTGALMMGLFLWYRKNKLNEQLREASRAALEYSDGSSDDPTVPLASPSPRSRPGGDGSADSPRRGIVPALLPLSLPDGPRPGTIAPPSSLTSQGAGPFADPASRYGRAAMHTISRESTEDSQNTQSHGNSSSSSYAGSVPRSGLGNGEVQSPTRRNSITRVLADATTNGRVVRAHRVQIPMADGEIVTFENGSAGLPQPPNQVRTVIYVPASNESRDIGPVIRAAQSAPIRPIEIMASGHASQRASIIEEQESDIPSSSVVPDTQDDDVDIAEFQASSVSRRFSAAAKAKDEGHVSEGGDETGEQSLGKDTPFELSTNNPTQELDTNGNVSTTGKTEQRDDGKIAGDGIEAQDDAFIDGDKAGRLLKSPVEE